MLSSKADIDHVLNQLANKSVLIRVDFNVPIKEGKVENATRIQGAIPTIMKILELNPQNVALMSHMGRPDGKRFENASLKIIVLKLEELLGTEVNFVNDCAGSEATQVANARNGQINLLENLRFHVQEDGKGDDAIEAEIKADMRVLRKLERKYLPWEIFMQMRAHSSMVGIDHKLEWLVI
ncbi:unnamed protein product [Paramecium octaurelia]|uniref:Phosphoglycerate kinase n=1 Tax=Paramecium octaurelia TaxID=43137 RepID=A0A8S1XKE9_PAROT|nr:unnamed protein product [Paramecium octaurelia]